MHLIQMFNVAYKILSEVRFPIPIILGEQLYVQYTVYSKYKLKEVSQNYKMYTCTCNEAFAFWFQLISRHVQK